MRPYIGLNLKEIFAEKHGEFSDETNYDENQVKSE